MRHGHCLVFRRIPAHGEKHLSGRTLALCLGLLGAVLLIMALSACAEPAPSLAATHIGPSDRGAAPSMFQGPEVGTYCVMIYDSDGGPGYGWGGRNDLQRQLIGHRVRITLC